MSAMLAVETTFAIPAVALAITSMVISWRAERRMDRVEANRRAREEREAASDRWGAGS